MYISEWNDIPNDKVDKTENEILLWNLKVFLNFKQIKRLEENDIKPWLTVSQRGISLNIRTGNKVDFNRKNNLSNPYHASICGL